MPVFSWPRSPFSNETKRASRPFSAAAAAAAAAAVAVVAVVFIRTKEKGAPRELVCGISGTITSILLHYRRFDATSETSGCIFKKRACALKALNAACP